jgi:SAM-dependent methyltransferase
VPATVGGALQVPSEPEITVVIPCLDEEEAALDPRLSNPPGYVPLNERPQGGHAKLLALVPDNARVLDVGCSSGYLARPLVQRGCTVVGIELDEPAAAAAREVCAEVLVGDAETLELPFSSGSFDVILCGDLIEHLRDPQGFLDRMRPLLRTGGRLVLTTPNVANWTIRVGLLLGRWRYTERGILDRTHAHLFTRKTLVEALVSAGYRVVEFDFTVPVPVINTPRVESVAHAVGRVRPSLLAYQFVVAATPA